jgi:hypothetical protein
MNHGAWWREARGGENKWPIGPCIKTPKIESYIYLILGHLTSPASTIV